MIVKSQHSLQMILFCCFLAINVMICSTLYLTVLWSINILINAPNFPGSMKSQIFTILFLFNSVIKFCVIKIFCFQTET